jgi:hypothetical protein
MKKIIIFILVLTFKISYGQEMDTIQEYRPFITMESFNDSLAYEVEVNTNSYSYVQFPNEPCEYVLIDVDTSYSTNFFLKVKDEYVIVNRGTAIIFQVENLNQIWCKGTTDGEIRVRYLITAGGNND